MTYTAVNGILTDRDPELMERYEPLVPMFELMRELFQILNDARRRRGSIDFDLNEAEVIIDAGGDGRGDHRARSGTSRIGSSRSSCCSPTRRWRRISKRRARRRCIAIHEEPDVLKVAKFEEFISGFGYSLGAPLDGAAAAAFPEADRADSAASPKRSRSRS